MISCFYLKLDHIYALDLALCAIDLLDLQLFHLLPCSHILIPPHATHAHLNLLSSHTLAPLDSLQQFLDLS